MTTESAFRFYVTLVKVSNNFIGKELENTGLEKTCILWGYKLRKYGQVAKDPLKQTKHNNLHNPT